MEPIQVAAIAELHTARQSPLHRRCIILGVGPSLVHARCPDEHDCVLAINRAVHWCAGRRRATVWVLRDWESFEDSHLTGWYDGVCIPSLHHDAIAPWVVDRSLYNPDPWRCLYGSNYSLPDAFPLAFLLGYDHVDLYGVDWCGESDYEGKQDVAGRSARRWNEERRLVTEVSAALGMTWSRF